MKRKIVITLIGLLSVILLTAGLSLADILMTPDDVEKISGQPDWVILDCRTKKKYDEGHIPGAINLGDSCRVKLRDGTQRVLPVNKLEKILGDAGIGNDKHVVVYSDGDIVHATVGFWILEYLGHDKVHFLDGGIVEWKAQGKPLSKEETKLQPTTFKAKVNKKILATTKEILQIAKGKKTDVQLIDARTEKEYKGNDIRALRGGRIPHTTVNISHELTFDKNTGKLLPAGVLASEKFYGKLDKDKRTIAYCQTGSRSTLTYLQLKLLGFKDIANYDDSWIVYGNSIYPPYPVEEEQWINLEPLSKDLPKLNKEIENLKKEIENLKTLAGIKKETEPEKK